jgi:hypothetical protein
MILDLLKDFDSFGQGVTVIGLLAAVASLLGTILNFLISKLGARRKLQLSEEKEFSSVLDSFEFSAIGSYLNNTLGRFTIEEYAHNTSVAQRVDGIISKALEFLGSEKEVQQIKPQLPPKEDLEIDTIPSPRLLSVQREINKAQFWNALARLRKEIGAFLRELALKNNLPQLTNQSVDFLVDELAIRNIIDSSAANLFRLALFTANRSIHGYDITYDEIESAISMTSSAMNSIEAQYEG